MLDIDPIRSRAVSCAINPTLPLATLVVEDMFLALQEIAGLRAVLAGYEPKPQAPIVQEAA